MENNAAEIRRRVGRWIVIAGAMLWAISLVIVVVVSPQGAVVSSDPGAKSIAHWIRLLPSAVGIALVLLLPRPAPPRPATVGERRPFTITTFALVSLAVVFPLAAANIPLEGELYVLGKLVLFMVIPGVLLLLARRSVKIQWNRQPSRWWAPAIVVVVWTVLSQIAPWNPRFEIAGLDPNFVMVAAVATALTAGVGEELFYRRWLQTRLEAGLGAWPGIVAASLAFALMHLASRGTGDIVFDVARVIVAQGSFGLFLGVMWWRYRNLTAIIIIHIFTNGWPVAAALLRN
ncbi:membrane protease YdiL (CAAX protease family) [Rhodoglobus vestalii]|uniref:Membrane protease YdiL (CAAX protease family) n=1 Tax=Rhodoglobus vestalii TaxID=193384 RepID=A0A8H2K735_9MICO|nr:type II CAAX endopeptidase family protein [Rhodoglobus vestalii]TQO19894.1 membrane protease YdiL (CAAX protease family) [Rhodoglobus vestalii]